MGGVAAFIIWVASQPSRWDGATLIKICHGRTNILRLRDGTIWSRRGYARYPVENPDTVCGN
jgi:hypothetical protein